jgi:PAS domain S-box-containing protein
MAQPRAISMRPLLDALPEPLLLLDLQGRLLHLNRAAAQWLGVAAQDMAGQPFQTLCADAPEAVAAALQQGARSTQFSPARLTIKRGSNEPCRCELARVAATDEHPAGLLIRLQPQAVAANRFLALNARWPGAVPPRRRCARRASGCTSCCAASVTRSSPPTRRRVSCS